MKKSYILGVLLLAAFVLSNTATASAGIACEPEGRNQTPKYDRQLDCIPMQNPTQFGYWFLGTTANWLVDGSLITEGEGKLATQTEEEFEVTDLKTSGGSLGVLCAAVLDGTVSFEGKDEITEVLDLEGHKIELGGTALLCKLGKVCEAGTDIEAWPENLPWTTSLSLMTKGPAFVDNIFGSSEKEPGWSVSCLVVSIKIEDLCEGPETAGTENVTEGATLETLNPVEDETKANCTLGGAGEGVVTGEALTLLTSGKTLTVSE